MRGAASIVIGIFLAAFTVSFWPAPPPLTPIAPRGVAPAAPMPLALPAPVAMQVVLRPRTASVEPPRRPAARRLPEVAAPPAVTPALDSRALAVAMVAAPAVLVADQREVTSARRGPVTRAVSTAGRRMSGAFRTAGGAIRAAF